MMVQKKKNMIKTYEYNKELYRKRIRIENTFQKMKVFRRIDFSEITNVLFILSHQ